MATEASWPGQILTQVPAISSGGLVQQAAPFINVQGAPGTQPPVPQVGGAGIGVNVVQSAPTNPPQTNPPILPAPVAAPVIPLGPAVAEAAFRAQFNIFPTTATELQ